MESCYATFALKPTAPQMLASTAPAPASSPAPAGSWMEGDTCHCALHFRRRLYVRRWHGRLAQI